MLAQITPVRTARDLETVRGLFRDYADGLSIDLGFQGFEAELAQLPGRYAPPGGDLMLAADQAGTALGCVALRALDLEGACEVKRLYVRPVARGSGLGRMLAETIIGIAAARGYREILLDTLPSMTSAISLYSRLGFEARPPYGKGIMPGMLYFSKNLRDGTAQASGA